jgi:hypothetical protein
MDRATKMTRAVGRVPDPNGQGRGQRPFRIHDRTQTVQSNTIWGQNALDRWRCPKSQVEQRRWLGLSMSHAWQCKQRPQPTGPRSGRSSLPHWPHQTALSDMQWPQPTGPRSGPDLACPLTAPCTNDKTRQERADAAQCWWYKAPSSWEPQEEGMMSTAASFSISKKPRYIDLKGKKPN